MNALTTNTAITMTSLELVDYINTQRGEGSAELAHSDFLKKVPQVLGEVAGNFSSYYIASNGKQNPCYKFPKREACLMAMSYSYDLQAKVFDRMTALENEAPKPIALSRMDLIKMAMESEELRLALEAKVTEVERESAQKQAMLEMAAPKVEALDRISAGKHTMCITDAAKSLKVTRNSLLSVMEKARWIYKRPLCKDWIAYDEKRHQGLLEYAYVALVHSNGAPFEKATVRVTQKGLVKLALLLNTQQKDAA